jgi:hypothetical protein
MNSTSDTNSLEIIYDELETSHGQKGVAESVGRMVRKIGILDTDQLAKNLAELHQQMDNMLQRVGHAASNYELKSFEVVADFTAKGGIRLIGSASGEFRGGIKLTFSRKPDAKGPG